MTKFEDLIGNYETKHYTITSEAGTKEFEIQKIDTLKIIAITGFPMIGGLADVAANKEKISEEQSAKLMQDPETASKVFKFMKSVCCYGILPIQDRNNKEYVFVDKPQKICNAGEVSIDTLTYTEIMEISNEILDFSAPKREVAAAESFRQTPADGRGKDDSSSDTSNSENVSPETVSSPAV